MKKSEIVLSKYSPLMVVDTQLVNSEGQLLETPRVYSLCRCGESNAKPFCDGTHSKVQFSGERAESDKPPVEHYEGKDLTIVYDKYLCMGAGHCGELPEVFGTHGNPKFDADEAAAEKVIETITKCPSGALTYIRNGAHEKDYFSETQIVIEKDGPAHCQGGIELKDDQASDALLPNADHYSLCRCGASDKKPLCDGSHKRKGFTG